MVRHTLVRLKGAHLEQPAPPAQPHEQPCFEVAYAVHHLMRKAITQSRLLHYSRSTSPVTPSSAASVQRVLLQRLLLPSFRLAAASALHRRLSRPVVPPRMQWRTMSCISRMHMRTPVHRHIIH
jgi:hypothetical protein